MVYGRPQFDAFVLKTFHMEEFSATLTAQNIAGLTLADGQEILGNPQQIFKADSAGVTTFLDVDTGDIEGEQVQDEITGDTAISSVSGKDGTYQLVQAKMEAQEERRRKQDEDDEADRNHAAVMERIEAARMTFSDGMYHFNGKDIRAEDMDAEMEESATEIDAQAKKYGWNADTTAQMTMLYDAWKNADSEEERADIFNEMRKTGGEHWANDRANEADDRYLARSNPHQQMTEVEHSIAASQALGNEVDRREALMSQDVGETSISREDQVETLERDRGGISVAGNPFESAYTASPEFNSVASGEEVQVAAAQPAQPLPNWATSVLSQG